MKTTAKDAWLVTADPRFLEIEPYSLELFKALLAAEPAAERTSVSFAADKLPAHLLGRARGGLTEALLASLPPQYPPASGEAVVRNCGQLREFRDKRGNLTEPLWYAGLGVLAFCEDGERLQVHDWSSGYPRYAYAETQERLERQKEFGPTTCEKLHSLNPAVCERCGHWGKINSPIVLGRDSEAALHTDPKDATDIGTPTDWELTQGGAINPRSYVNAVVALGRLGIEYRHDIFHDQKIVAGDAIENLGPELSDAVCRGLRDAVIARFRFDSGIENVRQAAERACEKNRFDPVVDYLLSLRWDGVERLDCWLVTYFGAEDTELNRATGRLILLAAVRRARQPGCKFDQIIVLEGVEGTNKSSAVELLAGKENFSDQTILGLDDRAQMERVKGKWLYEIADLTGMSKSEVDAVKAFASRTHDRARPAYGRFVVDQPRRCVFFATTNNDTYLKSQTGNRRFWPVKTQRIDIDALRRDRDQLWAEAAQAEANGSSLVLPEHLWAVARVEQEKRREPDPWDDVLADVKGEVWSTTVGCEERIASQQLLSGYLLLDIGKTSDREMKRLGYCMHRLGWAGPKTMRIKGKPTRGYRRPTVSPQEGVTGPLPRDP